MAPPTNRPRLSTIDPDALAIDIARAVADHIWQLGFALLRAPGDDVSGHGYDDERLAASEVARSVRYLARHAKDGTPPADRAPLQEHRITLIPLWQAPLGVSEDPEESLVVDPETELGCVLRASAAREAIDDGRRSVTPGELAVLAGLDVRQVQQLVTCGEIDASREGREYRVAPEEARRWLAARGVAGFGP